MVTMLSQHIDYRIATSTGAERLSAISVLVQGQSTSKLTDDAIRLGKLMALPPNLESEGAESDRSKQFWLYFVYFPASVLVRLRLRICSPGLS